MKSSVVLASIFLASSLFAAANQKIVEKDPAASTWTIVGSLDGKKMGFGQGTAITKRYLITCAHFWRVDDPQPQAFIFKNDLTDKRNVNVIYMDHGLDIAVLELDNKEKDFAKNQYIWLADSIGKGEKLSIKPASMGSADAIAAEAKVVDKNGTHSMLTALSGRFGHGHSGGGVFNRKGELAGVITHATKDGSIGAAVSVENLFDVLKRALRSK